MRAQWAAPESTRLFSVAGDDRLYLRIQVLATEARPDLRLALVGRTGTLAVPSASVTQAPCGPFWCVDAVIPPQTAGPFQEVELQVPGLALQTRTSLQSQTLARVQLRAEVINGNEQVSLQVQDSLTEALALEGGFFGRPRPFEVALAPGACGPEGVADWVLVAGWPSRQPVRFDPIDKLACARARPAGLPEGPAVAAETIAARARIARFRHVYIPPTRAAPLSLALLLDLEIPNPARCRTTLAAVADTFEGQAQTIAEQDRRGAPVLRLRSVQIAEVGGQGCRQSSDRRFDAAAVAAAWAAELQARTGGEATRLAVIYVTNLALPAPPSFRALLGDLLEALETQHGLPNFFMAMGPELALDGLPFGATTPWISTLEPSFPDAVAGLLGRVFPFESLDHTSATEIPLLRTGEGRDLIAWRPCSSTFGIEPLGTRLGPDTYAPRGDGPVYRVPLPEQSLVPSPIFRAPVVEVEWEGCFELCDRASAPGRSSWLEGGRCAP